MRLTADRSEPCLSEQRAAYAAAKIFNREDTGMKKVKTRAISLLLCLIMALSLLPATAFAASSVAINSTNFPDGNFRYYVSAYFDKNKDGKLSPSEIADAEEINVQGWGIYSLKGVEFLTALTTLDCSWNYLNKLNVNQNRELLTLKCGGNNLTSLKVTRNTKLQVLYCENNDLVTLDVTKNPELNELSCSGNDIGTLNILKNPRLIHAYRKGDSYIVGNVITYWITQFGGGVSVTFSLGVDRDTKLQAGSAQPPVITSQPKNKVAAVGKIARFYVTAQGEGLSYQWYVSKGDYDAGTKLEGETGTRLSVTVKKNMKGYKYYCVVTGAGGVVFTRSAALRVVTEPKITGQPRSVTAKAGKKVTFRVKASGGYLKYQWYLRKPNSTKWQLITSGTKASYTFTAKKAKNGYKYRCLVSNAAGEVYTKAVKLTVK